MGKKLAAGILALMFFGAFPVMAQSDSVDQQVPDSGVVADTGDSRVIAYYFHSERRCATCMKLEAYSQEAIESGFGDLLADSSLVWRVVNFESADNEHFAKGYQLYSQAVILSRLENGTEVGWVNLDQIWTLVGDKEKFVAYIQTETKRFLDGTSE
jgi:hypothetical protein